MRDVDRRDLELVVQAADLEAHLLAQVGVEVGQRLVEQQHLGLDDDGAGQRHALLLAARQLGRIAVLQRAQLHDVEDACRRGASISAARQLAQLAGRSRRSRPPSCSARSRSSGRSSTCRASPAAPRRPAEEITWPSISIVPASGGMKPAIMRSVVVLPQPEGPSSETNSPCCSSRREVAAPRRRCRSSCRALAGQACSCRRPPQHEVAARAARWPIHEQRQGQRPAASAPSAARYSKLPSSLMSNIMTDMTLVLGPYRKIAVRQLARRRDEDQQPGADQAALQQRRHDAAHRRSAGCRPGCAPPPPSRD